MLTIRLAGRSLWLKPGTTLQLTYNSSLFSEEVLQGTFSYSFTLPLNRQNRAVFGYPDLIENVADLRRTFDDCEVEEAGFLIGRGGQLRIRQVLPQQVSVAVGFGLSAAASDVRERRLGSFAYGGQRLVPALVPYGGSHVAGIVLHANEVVNQPESYDYVFAPVLNHYGAKEATNTEAAIAPTLLNPWLCYDVPLLIAPQANGSFLFRVGVQIPGAAVPGDSMPLPYAPFPKVSYLLRAIFQELGFTLRADCFAGELGQLVVLHGNIIISSFRLNELLPELTVKDFLLKLRNTLGLIADLGADGQVTLLTWQQVLAEKDYDDWSDVATSGFTTRDVPDVAGKTLTYHLAGDDKQAEAFFQGPPTGVPIGAPVVAVEDLPAPDSSDLTRLPADELRVVTSLGQYYRQQTTIDFTTGAITAAWTPAGSVYTPVDVAGGGDAQEQGIAATAVETTALQNIRGFDEHALVPAITEAPTGTVAASGELRLAFYRGRRPYQDHPTDTYPLLTPFDCDATGQLIGEQSLQLHGAQGTVARLLGEWLELVATTTPVKHTFYLTPRHLAGLRWGRKVMVHGNLFLVQQVQVTVPVEKGATVTLIPLPRG